MPSVGFKIFDAYQFAAEHGLQSDLDTILSTPIHSRIKRPHVVRKGRLVQLFEERGLMAAFTQLHWPALTTQAGQRRRKQYLEQTVLNDRLMEREEVDEVDAVEGPPLEEESFAVEADLRNFLGHNLQVIEPGLKLYAEGDRQGIEYVLDGGRIDILAIDRDGRPVVIELKLSRGRNRTIGQLLYYMGWVDQHLSRGPSRGMIVAREIPDDLRLATARVDGVSLFRYRISMSLERIQTGGSTSGKA